MKVRPRSVGNNHYGDTQKIPKVVIRDCGTEETKIMGAIREPEVIPGDNTANYPERARAILNAYLLSGFETGIAPDFGVYVVWHCKTLQHWKAMLGTALLDGKYYEITHNGDKGETYIDEYGKVNNFVIKDAA